MSYLFNTKPETPKRKQLRNNLPAPEIILWSKLRGKQLAGYKFRRQESIGRYVVDFYCPVVHLIVEIDGDSHFTPDAEDYDKDREAYFDSLGLNIIRFTNEEVTKNLYGVLDRLLQEVKRLSRS